MTVQAFPLDGWLAALALGWRLANPLEVVHAGCGHDGTYAVRMWRRA